MSFTEFARRNPLPDGFIPESTPEGSTPGTTYESPTRTDTFDGSATRSRASISQLHQQPGRSKCRTLHPKRLDCAIWFKYDKDITDNIKGMIYSNFKTPYATFKKFPQSLSESWWEHFAQQFNWHQEDETKIKSLWSAKASYQFSHHVSEWKQKWKKGEDKPVHVTNDVWNWFNTYWDREDVKQQSTKNAVNRRGKNGKADLKTHNNGSRSFEMTEDELTKKANGIKPDLITLMEITHTNKKTKEIDNKRVAGILTNAKRKVQCRATQLSQREDTSSCSVPTIEINKIIVEEATTKALSV